MRRARLVLGMPALSPGARPFASSGRTNLTSSSRTTGSASVQPVRSFTVSSALATDPATVWEAVTTVEGVNYELGPIVRMTVPRGGDTTLRTGPLGRSWILLLGVLPIDYDDLNLAAIEPGRGFRERSRLGSCSVWQHDRSLQPIEGGCRVVDRIGFVPRVRPLGGLMEFLFEATFRWRHRRLQARFSPAPPPLRSSAR